MSLVSHAARRGRGVPIAGFHNDTRSTVTGAWTIGTSADWLRRTVIGCVSLYSNRSPRSVACAAAGASRSRASTSLAVTRSALPYADGAGGGGAALGRPPTTPPSAPPGTPSASAGETALAIASIVASWVCGVSIAAVGSGTTGRRVYSGCEICWMKDCGAPATSESSTSVQSSPSVLSTTAQPCRNGGRPAAVGITSLYVDFHTGTSLT